MTAERKPDARVEGLARALFPFTRCGACRISPFSPCADCGDRSHSAADAALAFLAQGAAERIAEVLREAKASAWDEGASMTCGDGWEEIAHLNPYRKEQDR